MRRKIIETFHGYQLLYSCIILLSTLLLWPLILLRRMTYTLFVRIYGVKSFLICVYIFLSIITVVFLFSFTYTYTNANSTRDAYLWAKHVREDGKWIAIILRITVFILCLPRRLHIITIMWAKY